MILLENTFTLEVMEKEILINLQIQIETTGEQSTRVDDPRKLPGILLFINNCNSLVNSLSLPEGQFVESTEDIEGAYPNCLWFCTATFNIDQKLSFLDANRLISIIQNFSLYHDYKLIKAVAQAVVT